MNVKNPQKLKNLRKQKTGVTVKKVFAEDMNSPIFEKIGLKK
jgi:hypothetical protein